jgi:hypothetical protein
MTVSFCRTMPSWILFLVFISQVVNVVLRCCVILVVVVVVKYVSE